MLEIIFNGSFMPHGHCLLWRWDLLFLHVAGDALTATSYALIPIALIHIVRKRDDLKFDRLFLLFAGFISFCGITHLLGLVNIWHGYYFVEGLAKLTTGIISAVTALALWKLTPSIIALPSSALLAQRNRELLNAQEELKEINLTLEAKIEERTRELHIQANTDPLTSILNRRAILQNLENEISQCERHNQLCSVLMLDVDYFKKINDSYGHQFGDDVLVMIADTITQTCRQTDYVGRYGGEEFLIILTQTNEQQAKELAERIRKNISALSSFSPLLLQSECSISCSIGIATLTEDHNIHALIKRADEAVYNAKHGGRNRVATSK